MATTIANTETTTMMETSRSEWEEFEQVARSSSYEFGELRVKIKFFKGNLYMHIDGEKPKYDGDKSKNKYSNRAGITLASLEVTRMREMLGEAFMKLRDVGEPGQSFKILLANRKYLVVCKDLQGIGYIKIQDFAQLQNGELIPR